MSVHGQTRVGTGRGGHAVLELMAATWRLGFRRLRRAGRLLGQLFDISGGYFDSGQRAKLASAMVEYAKLCIKTAGGRDLAEAASYLTQAAAIYREIGRPEEAEAAMSLISRVEGTEEA